jgi:peroxiredoxin
MKNLLIVTLTASLLLAAAPGALGAEEKKDAKAQLEELVGKVRTKLGEGKSTEESLAAELKQFDALLAEHQGEKTDDVAQILFMKAMLYDQVLDQQSKGVELLEQLQKDFPDTAQAKTAGQMISAIKKQAELVVGKTFPDFNEKDLDGEPLSIAKYKGKVVLVDFWATWCGPCVGELPNVLEAYKKHHDAGFEIIGISLDSDKAKLTTFIKQKEMPWKQYFDGKGWQTKLAQEYGISSIPATYLLDREGRIIARNLRGEALEAEVAKALAKK